MNIKMIFFMFIMQNWQALKIGGLPSLPNGRTGPGYYDGRKQHLHCEITHLVRSVCMLIAIMKDRSEMNVQQH